MKVRAFRPEPEPVPRSKTDPASGRPPPEGVSYGARVYVDRGEPDTVYTSAAVEGDATLALNEEEATGPNGATLWPRGQQAVIGKGATFMISAGAPNRVDVDLEIQLGARQVLDDGAGHHRTYR